MIILDKLISYNRIVLQSTLPRSTQLWLAQRFHLRLFDGVLEQEINGEGMMMRMG